MDMFSPRLGLVLGFVAVCSGWYLISSFRQRSLPRPQNDDSDNNNDNDNDNNNNNDDDDENNGRQEQPQRQQINTLTFSVSRSTRPRFLRGSRQHSSPASSPKNQRDNPASGAESNGRLKISSSDRLRLSAMNIDEVEVLADIEGDLRNFGCTNEEIIFFEQKSSRMIENYEELNNIFALENQSTQLPNKTWAHLMELEKVSPYLIEKKIYFLLFLSLLAPSPSQLETAASSLTKQKCEGLCQYARKSFDKIVSELKFAPTVQMYHFLLKRYFVCEKHSADLHHLLVRMNFDDLWPNPRTASLIRELIPAQGARQMLKARVLKKVISYVKAELKKPSFLLNVTTSLGFDISKYETISQEVQVILDNKKPLPNTNI